MSIFSNVAEQDLIILRKLAEQQKNQRALNNKNRNLNQTHDIKLAESFSRITKKSEEINQSTKNLGEGIKKSNFEIENNQKIVPIEIESEDETFQTNLRALPNSSIFSELMTKTLRRLMSSCNSLKVKSFPCGATIPGVPIYTLGGDKLRIRDDEYELTEVYKALSYTGYTGKSMKNENENHLLMLNINRKGLRYTGIGDKPSKRKTFLTITLLKLVEEIQSKAFDEIVDSSDNLQEEGVKYVIPSNINDIYTGVEVLLGLNLSGHTDTLTEASNLIDELYKRGEIQNELQYRNAPNKFSTH